MLNNLIAVTFLFKLKLDYELWEGWAYPVRECCKVKGFRLHYDAQQVINFAGLLELFRQRKVQLQAEQLMFNYNPETHQMTTNIVNKALIFDYTKGLIGGPNMDMAFPYGSEKYWDPETRYCEEGERRRVR